MDWKSLIASLQEHGLTQAVIAARCEVGQATISDIARGKTTDPQSSTAERLKSLHKAVLRRAKRAPKPAPAQSTQEG